ncbi:MAG: hypothetical protein U0746_09920 [Gemmataceae bacterium]
MVARSGWEKMAPAAEYLIARGTVAQFYRPNGAMVRIVAAQAAFGSRHVFNGSTAFAAPLIRASATMSPLDVRSQQ